VAAAILLTGKTNATFRIGDGTVVGADVEFRDMVLRQDGDILILSGTYDNNTKNEGEVFVTVQAISKGQEQLVSFTVPVEAGKGKSFTQQKAAGSIKLSGATLSSLVFKGGGGSNSGNNSTYPWDQQSAPNQQSAPSYPVNPTSPSDDLNIDQESIPFTIPDSTTLPQFTMPSTPVY
jgi:hypothetical protein